MVTKRAGWVICGTVILSCLASAAMRQTELGSEFTYQGFIKLAGEILNDTADFEFTLWDADADGEMIGLVVPADNVTVVDGLFTVQLDFGVMPFNGDALWLQIAVRSPAGGGKFTPLLARQPLTATPYALQTRGIFVDIDKSVGIGTINPLAKLDVVGTIRIADGSEGDGKVLTSDADGIGLWQAPAGGGFSNMEVFSTPGAIDFVVPAGVTRVMVEVRGGGGGGGKGNAGGGAVGQGGSGSGYGMGIFIVAPGSMHLVTVGAGGLGSNGGTCTVGQPGGTSSFGSLILATGGGGGGGCGSTSTPGSSTAPLSMTGEKGRQYFSSGSTPENPGGPCGDGSTIGRGGNGNEFFGRDGNPGNVVVFW